MVWRTLTHRTVCEQRTVLPRSAWFPGCGVFLGAVSILISLSAFPFLRIAFHEFSLAAASQPLGITSGPDGNLWFAEAHGNRIGKITPSGEITEFPLPTLGSVPQAIT